MQLTSIYFFIFFSILYFIYYIIQKNVKKKNKFNKIINILILIFSLIFILYSDYRFLIITLLICLNTWYFGKNNKYYYIGIIINILSLMVFKYTNFFIDSINKVFGLSYNSLKIILPIGISFYIFSAISYLVDIKRNKIKSSSLLDVTLYLCYFPKLLSGPIVRFDDFSKELNKDRKIGFKTFNEGIQIFVFGLFKKIVIADHLNLFINQVYGNVNSFSSFTVLFAVISYSIQIYCDFSGYSDMAIGVSRMLDINLPRNFNLPYLSHNVTELWKRWHITLSSWLQDYLYIGMGGNRKGKIRGYVNLILTMVIGGLWHGANICYIIWGLLHGLSLVIHKIWMKLTNSKDREHSLISNIISIIVTFFVTSFFWIPFKTESLNKTILIIKRIFSFKSGLSQIYSWSIFSIVVILVASIIATIKSKDNKNKLVKKNNSYVEGYYPILDLNKFWNLVLFFVFIGITIGLAYTGGSPFIYGNY